MGTALNALRLLELFSNARPEIGLTQMARLSGVNKATVLRHLRELEEFGLIEQNQGTKSYMIGPAALRLAALREIANPGLKAARLKMQAAMQQAGESLHLSLLENDVLQTALVVETTQHSVRVSLDPTEVLPLNATASGLCMLCFGPPALLEGLKKRDLPRITASTLTNLELIQERLVEVKETGWSYSNGSFETGVHGFAAPVFGIDQLALGTVSFAVPEIRTAGDLQPPLLNTLKQVSQELTAIFGGQAPANFPTEFRPSVRSDEIPGEF